MTFTLNGNSTDIKGRHPHLLSALRDELGVISPKDGCAPSGECGCCVVLIDGRAATSCTQSVDSIEGKDIVTLEGVDEAEVDRYARAFASTGALQCGFCTPGFLKTRCASSSSRTVVLSAARKTCRTKRKPRLRPIFCESR